MNAPTTATAGQRGTGGPAPARSRLLAATVTPMMRWLVARLSVPPGTPWRTGCDHCELPLGLAAGNCGALLPAARCGGCGSRTGAPPYAVEIAMIAAFTVVALTVRPWPLLLAALWWTTCAVALVFVDLRVHRLPDQLTWPALAGVLTFELVDGALHGSWAALGGAVVTAAGCTAVFLLTTLLMGRRGLGLGDVKLVGSIALLLGWWGPGAVFLGVFIAFFSAGATAVVLLAARRVDRRDHLPMGPHLVLGAILVLAMLRTGS